MDITDFKALLKPVTDMISSSPVEAAALTGAVVLLKGAPSYIVAPGKDVFVNATGNEGMATAGSGDVLTGAVAGIAAQGANLFDASVLGAYIHGLAGDYAADEMTVPGMTAGDILERIPAALSDIIDEQVQEE